MNKENKKQNKAIKFRIYPNLQQKELIDKTIGCARLVYNLMLDYQNKRYENKEKYQSYFEMKKYFIANIKSQEQYKFLKEVDKWSLDCAMQNLDNAFKRFFDNCKKHKKGKKGYPKFKNRYTCKKTYTTLNVIDAKSHNSSIQLFRDNIKLPKLKEIKATITQIPKYDFVIKRATITKDRDNKYYCSICYEYEEEIKQKELKKGIGLDYSSAYLYIDSEGNKAPNHIKTYKCSEEKLKHLQKQLAKKKKHSKNFEKVRLKIAKTYKHITNARKDYLHKLSYNLSNKYDYICVENLNLKGMTKYNLAKQTLDNAYGTFITYLDYKLKDRGKTLVKVNTFYPSSQLCNICGYQNKEVKNLLVREWTCPNCKTHHDRDINASKNILKEGQRILREQKLLVA